MNELLIATIVAFILGILFTYLMVVIVRRIEKA
jgi:hypothetical protein